MIKVFDNKKFYDALNKKRKSRGLAWNKVATRAGITHSNLANYVAQFEKPGAPTKHLSLESVIQLMQWLDVTDLDQFLSEEE